MQSVRNCYPIFQFIWQMTVKIYKEVLLLARKEGDREVNTEKTQYYMLVSHQRECVKNHKI
jgi:hypothetical protein